MKTGRHEWPVTTRLPGLRDDVGLRLDPPYPGLEHWNQKRFVMSFFSPAREADIKEQPLCGSWHKRVP